VTASAADPGGGYDFVSRFFAPADGIPADPVTGSVTGVECPVAQLISAIGLCHRSEEAARSVRLGRQCLTHSSAL
jgi:predicted PhzF superfamily epimerase YddE/YHI9